MLPVWLVLLLALVVFLSAFMVPAWVATWYVGVGAIVLVIGVVLMASGH